MNRWWEEDSAQRYWLETTQREDIGADLHAPTEDYRGQEYWSYALVREVRDGDVVFHYEKDPHAIRSWSRATGGSWHDTVFWGARGTVGRDSDPYDRPGWRHGLDGPFALPEPLTLDTLRDRETAIRHARDQLAATYPGSLYFPFELSERRPLRAQQGYLFKLPAELLPVLPELQAGAAGVTDTDAPPTAPLGELGVDYRPASEDTSVSKRDPFETDPAVVDRGVQGHARTQNALAEYVRSKGLIPRSPSSAEPAFDLAWQDQAATWVAEVKSLTPANEERQLRLGIGQLLRYRFLLRNGGSAVNAALVVEREPAGPGWVELCDELGVTLAWPTVLADRL